MSINPIDFKISANKLREKLLKEFETEDHPDISTRAFCILQQAGARDAMENESASKVQKALTRLLVNEDDDATRTFLVTIADSVAAATMPVTS